MTNLTIVIVFLCISIAIVVHWIDDGNQINKPIQEQLLPKHTHPYIHTHKCRCLIACYALPCVRLSVGKILILFFFGFLFLQSDLYSNGNACHGRGVCFLVSVVKLFIGVLSRIVVLSGLQENKRTNIYFMFLSISYAFVTLSISLVSRKLFPNQHQTHNQSHLYKIVFLYSVQMNGVLDFCKDDW